MAYNLVFSHSSNLFRFVKFENKFVATLSELGCNGIDTKCAEFFQPIEKGFGFVFVSASTGQKVPMRLVRTNKIKSDWHEEDWDVRSWVFKPTRGREFFLEIVNDM